MTVSALAAAKRMCARSGWSLSNLELQKLLYVAHMFHLGEHGGEPLVSGSFEAWDYGPVHPTLYHHVKVFGADAVGNVFNSVSEIPPGHDAAMLDAAFDQLGHAAPGKLVAITHWEQGAWAKYYVRGQRGIVIPNDAILQEYRDRENVRRANRPAA